MSLQVLADLDGCLPRRLGPRARRERPGTEHTPADKIWNHGISRLCWAVEHAIAHWKILATGYRGRLTELPTLIQS